MNNFVDISKADGNNFESILKNSVKENKEN
jgi:hypothetical protein